LHRLQESEAYREIENISQKTVEGKEITPALPESPDAISKSVNYDIV